MVSGALPAPDLGTEAFEVQGVYGDLEGHAPVEVILFGEVIHLVPLVGVEGDALGFSSSASL